MQSISLDAKAKDDRMQDAFKDLEVLMVRAGEMVRTSFPSDMYPMFIPADANIRSNSRNRYRRDYPRRLRIPKKRHCSAHPWSSSDCPRPP